METNMTFKAANIPANIQTKVLFLFLAIIISIKTKIRSMTDIIKIPLRY